MRYDVRRRTLTLERRPCRHCKEGITATRIDCPQCAGTGTGPRNGRGGCKPCHGSGDAWDWINTTICDHCGGLWEQGRPEEWKDTVPPEAMLQIPIRVLRQTPDGWPENVTGLGLVRAVKDYGAASRMDDDQLTARVRKNLMDDPPTGNVVTILGDAQRRKVVRGLVLTVTRIGYSVHSEVLVTRPRERPEPRPQRPIRVGSTPSGVCPKCYLVHVGECY